MGQFNPNIDPSFKPYRAANLVSLFIVVRRFLGAGLPLSRIPRLRRAFWKSAEAQGRIGMTYEVADRPERKMWRECRGQDDSGGDLNQILLRKAFRG
jgi:hypothetical protein